MNIFDELGTQYFEIDNIYSKLEFEAASKGWTKKELKLSRKRNLNDQAYFVFMFSRLEDRIKQSSNKAILSKQSSISSWKPRAAWDILPKDLKNNMHFMKKLAILTDQTGKDYKLVSDYYDQRNSIAHGGSFTVTISIPKVISDLKRLYKILKP